MSDTQRIEELVNLEVAMGFDGTDPRKRRFPLQPTQGSMMCLGWKTIYNMETGDCQRVPCHCSQCISKADANCHPATSG